MGFPKDFLWGATTSSYQIEGAWNADGRGETVWDRFCHTVPNKVANRDSGDVACDHYHRYREDVALMCQIGLQAYRFSVAWSRVLPAGIGSVNTKGLDFYSRLVDELLASGIQPYLTLYHWDTPQALQDRGGWANSASVQWFAEYTEVMTRHLGDRVQNWTTHNEPWIVAFVGYFYGGHPPGMTDLTTAYQVAHHLLLAHGAAAPIIRQNVPNSRLGISLNLNPIYPGAPETEHMSAAYRQDGFLNRWMLDPLFKGVYPADMVTLVEPYLPPIDLAAIQSAAVPLDFLGVNYYLRNVVLHDDNELPLRLRHMMPEDAQKTAMGWEIFPEGLTALLVRLQQDYAPAAIYITENGSAFEDTVSADGTIHDPQRIAYFESHLAALEQAIEQGAAVKGYFVWSLMDNFEWSHGYDKRFGLIYVDYTTQKRILKKSALYYRDKIRG